MLELPKIAAIGLHLASWHSEPGYNNFNPGGYVRFENHIQLGGYYNSVKKPSFYAAYIFDQDNVHWMPSWSFALVGVASGYEWSPVGPIGALGVKIRNIRLSYIPSYETVPDQAYLASGVAARQDKLFHTFHLSVEF